MAIQSYVATSTTRKPLHANTSFSPFQPSPLSISVSPSTAPSSPLSLLSTLTSPFSPGPEDYVGDKYLNLKLPERLSARLPMPSDFVLPKSHWLSRLRSTLRLLNIVLSGAVVCMLVHTLEIYRGNRYIDLRSGELPMTWPARTNLVPTLILFAIAAGNFLASLAILVMSFTRSFRRPMRSRDVYRIVAGSLGVIMWATALAVFHLLDKHNKASLGRYSCTNKNVLSNGRYQYRAVCEEQGVAFYLAIGAAISEALTLLTLAVSAACSVKFKSSPLIKCDHKKDSKSFDGDRYR